MLDVDRHVAGLDQEAAHPGGRVLYHQFAGGVVVLSRQTAGSRQQAVDLVPQPSLGQGDVQQDGRGRLCGRGGQPVQLIQIDGKAHRPRPGGELAGQQIVPAAPQHRPGRALQIPLKDQAVVIFHLPRKGQVDLHPLPGAGHRRPQLGHGGPHGAVAAGFFGPGQHRRRRAAEFQQRGQGAGSLPVQTGGESRRPQLVVVARPQPGQHPLPGRLGHVQRVHQAGQVPHVPYFQPPGGAHALGQPFQRADRQRHRLAGLGLPHPAQELDAHLGDLLKSAALGRGAVDVLTVIKALCLAGGGLGALGDGQGDVRFEGQQPPVQIGEGDDLPRRQEALVFLIEGVFFKLAHVILAAPCPLVQGPQPEGGPLLGLQQVE